MSENRFLQAKCKELLVSYQDVFDALSKEIYDEVEKERITGDNAFDYARKTIRKEAIREGITLFLAKINKKANER